MTLVLLAAGAVQAQNSFHQLEDLLERGLYNSAALVAGPALVEANPDNRRAFELYARALLLSGDSDSARDALEAMFRLGPDEPVSPSELQLTALILAEEGEMSLALPLVKAAATQTGSYSYAMDWGRIAWQAMDVEEAELAYRTAAETPRGQQEPWPWLDLGRLLMFQGRLGDAEAALEQAIATYEAFDTGASLPSPAYVEAFYRLGELEELRFASTDANESLARAASNYRSALVGDPNYSPARRALERLEADSDLP